MLNKIITCRPSTYKAKPLQRNVKWNIPNHKNVMTEITTKLYSYKFRNLIPKYCVPTFIDYRNSEVQNLTSENNKADI